MTFYSFLSNKAQFYYFYIGIVFCSIPIVFKIYIVAILIIPELIFLLILMYRGLSKGESNIKIYEVGLTNIPTNLTKVEAGQKQIRTIPIKDDNKERKPRTYSIIMVIISIVLSTIFLIGSIASM